MAIGQVRVHNYMSIGTYILKCNNERYYIGSTNNIDRRLSEHQGGYVKATQNILPITLVFFQKCDRLIDARTLENILKRKKSSVIIKRIIADGYIKFMGR